MKATKMMFAAALISAAAALSAQAPAPAAAAPAAAVKPAEAPKPASLEEMLAFLPETVAQAEDAKITKKEVIQRLRDMRVPLNEIAKIPEAQFKGIIKRMVENLILEKLMLKKAAAAGFTATEEWAKAAIMKRFKELPKPQQDQILQSSKKNVEEIAAEGAKNATQRNYMAIQSYMEGIFKAEQAKISDADVTKFYNDNKEKEFKQPANVTVSHILVLANGQSPDGKPLSKEEAAKQDADAQKKIADVKARLDKGEDFGKLAQEISDCPSGKQNKGQLPAFSAGQMVPEFEKAAFAMSKPGEVSGVVKTMFGYHLIKFHGKKEAGYIPLNDALKKNIKDVLAGQATDKQIKAMVEELKNSGKIKINGFDAPAAPAPAKK